MIKHKPLLAKAGALCYNTKMDRGVFKKMIFSEKNELREISIEGARKIGEGAHGEVYRISEDTIAKVYRPFVSLDSIKKEKELSRWSFVKGLPTAISFDIVRVGDSYGVVYEMLDACSASDYIRESEEKLDDFIYKSVDLMNQIHAVEVKPGELPDMKEQTLGWIDKCRHYMDDATCDRLRELTEALPDSHTLLHADYHLKNIMVSGGELMLIDMDTLCMGDPIFELATIYNSYKEFPSVSPEAAAFLGIDVDTAGRIWDKTLKVYMGQSAPADMEKTAMQAQLFGCIRIIDFMDRHSEHEDKDKCINICVRDIRSILEKNAT